jgi:non-heme chloroperoxidase
MSSGHAIRSANIQLDDGTRLHYVESGRADGQPVLFLHGWPDSWFSFSRVLPSLPPALRAIVIDQRGFGDSDRPDDGYAIRDLGADAIAVLDALGIDRAAVVGHSFGSFIARSAAVSHPDRIANLALIDTGFADTNPVIHDLQASLRDLPDPIPEAFAREFQASTVYRPLPQEFFDRLIVETLKLPSRLWRPLIDRLIEYDDIREVGRIAVPTLLLWGDRDALFSRSEQDRFLEALPSAELIVYADTGHCPNWERPDDVAADISRFVRR